MESILQIAQSSISGVSFIKYIDEFKTAESKMLLDDIDSILKTSERFIVVVHPDDSAEAHIMLNDEEMIDLANSGSRFFRFSMSDTTS